MILNEMIFYLIIKWKDSSAEIMTFATRAAA